MSVTPIFDQGRGFRLWNSTEVYTGPDGTGRFVPNVNDGILSWSQGFLRVIGVDYNTGLSVWQNFNLGNVTGVNQQEDVLTSVGPGTVSEAFRIYINDQVLPYTLKFDVRTRMYGSRASYIKVFKGTDISNTGNVISAMYNSSQIKTSENIPLELVLYSNAENYAVKTPVEAYASDLVTNGEFLTVVIYSSDGGVTGISHFIACITDGVRTINVADKEITNIDIVSQYISTTDNRLLEYPLNMPIQSGALLGRVRYNDGTSATLPIDGTKFELLGMDNYIASEVGQTFPLQLKYNMSPNEKAFGTSAPIPERSITRTYRIRTVESDNAYSVKLFVVPYWDNTNATWKLDYYLYSLERDTIYYVTPYIEVGATSPTFNGTNYSTRQDLAVAFNMNNLGSSFSYFRHVQTFSIQLHTPGSNATTNNYWTLYYTPDLVYGQGQVAELLTSISSPTATINIANGYTIVDEWLSAHYRRLSPLYYTVDEGSAPDPTHFRVRIGNTWSREIAVANFANDIDSINVSVSQGMAVRLEFFRRTTDRDLELALGTLTLKT